MSPREVAGLHALALKHGGSLTVNPDTGLPEAGFLDKLLPTIIGGGISYLSGGMIDPMTAAAMVGGVETVRTGSLERGLMAGFGAYGGAGLAQGFMGAGTSALSSGALGTQALETAGYTPELAASTPLSEASELTRGAAQQAPLMDKFSAGAKSVMDNPMGFAKDNFKYLAGAAAPIVADMMVPTTTKMPEAQNPGYIRQKVFDPGTQTYRSLTPVKANEWKDRSFSDIYRGYNGGGIVALAGGGMPMYAGATDGSVVGATAAPNYEQLVKDAYANIGRTGVGEGAGQIDKEGLNFWTNALSSGAVTANDLNKQFGAAVNTYIAEKPEDKYTQQVQNYQANQLTGGGGAAADTSGITALTGATGTGVNTTQATPMGASLDTSPPNAIVDTTGITALQPQATTLASSVLPPPTQISTADAQTAVNNIYRNVLGRDADAVGLNFWSNAIANGRSVDSVYQDILKSANQIKTAGTLGNFGINALTAAEAAKPYTGYTSTASDTVADEWVRNVLGREPTAAEKAQSWYKDSSNLGTTAEAAKVYRDFKDYAASKGKATNLSWMEASQLKALPTTKVDTIVGGTGNDTIVGGTGNDVINNTFGSSTEVDRKITNPFGNATNPGDLTYNADGTITVQPNIPGRPYGGFSGMDEVRNAYTKGGGSLGYTSRVVNSADEHDELYNRFTPGGDSEAAYRYLMGLGAYPTKSKVGEIMRPYREATMGYPTSTNKAYNYDAATGKMVRNPDYVAPGRDAAGNVNYSMSLNEMKKYLTANPLSGQALYDWAQSNGASAQDVADATGRKLSEVYAEFRDASKKAAENKKTATTADTTASGDSGYQPSGANGGMMSYAMGGYAVGGGLGTLGGYSDGGRLLKGPGDGVSDSIPATIGQKQQPARLADGEFVVPARIVSELGNGSTEAGAKKLYAMMDRVQRARGKTTGKNKVAANSRADKYLPA